MPAQYRHIKNLLFCHAVFFRRLDRNFQSHKFTFVLFFHSAVHYQNQKQSNVVKIIQSCVFLFILPFYSSCTLQRYFNFNNQMIIK